MRRSNVMWNKTKKLIHLCGRSWSNPLFMYQMPARQNKVTQLVLSLLVSIKSLIYIHMYLHKNFCSKSASNTPIKYILHCSNI